MGKKLSYHRTLISRAPCTATAAEVTDEVRTENSSRAERLDIGLSDPQVITPHIAR